jgi:hypothetical protein
MCVVRVFHEFEIKFKSKQNQLEDGTVVEQYGLWMQSLQRCVLW